MSINWHKKKSVTLKWLGVGPAYLLYLVLFEDVKVFAHGIAGSIFLCGLAIVSPAVLVFLVYWPLQRSQEQPQKDSAND